jgi:hypothetical protein
MKVHLHSLNSALDGVGRSTPRTDCLNPRGKRLATHSKSDQVSLFNRSGRVRKVSPPPGFDGQSSYPVAIPTELPSHLGIHCLQETHFTHQFCSATAVPHTLYTKHTTRKHRHFRFSQRCCGFMLCRPVNSYGRFGGTLQFHLQY